MTTTTTLFGQYIQESRINEISRIETEISRLQSLLTELQAKTQIDLALEQVCNSALEQLLVAMTSVLSQNPELKGIFADKANEILSMTAVGEIMLPGSSNDGDPDDDNTPPDNDPPTPPTPPNGGNDDGEAVTVDVDVVVQPQTEETEPELQTANNTAIVPAKRGRKPSASKTETPNTIALPKDFLANKNGNDILTEKDLEQLDIEFLRHICKEFSISIRGNAKSKFVKALMMEELTKDAFIMIMSMSNSKPAIAPAA